MGHHKTICRKCKTIINQCRCMDCNKTIKYGVCVDCVEPKSDKIKEIAIFMHNTYEELSKETGWDTQKSCKVEFDDLPKNNKKVMLGVAKAILQYTKKRIEAVEKDRCLDRLDAWNEASTYVSKDIKNIIRINLAQEKLILKLQKQLKRN